MSAPTATDQTRGGYLGQSMSVRAAAAYDDDARPLSKITAKWLRDHGINCTPAELRDLVSTLTVTTTEWHHTGKHFAMTDFYRPDELRRQVNDLTREQIAAARVEAKSEREAETQFLEVHKDCTVEWLEWFGKGVRPNEHRAEGATVRIQIRRKRRHAEVVLPGGQWFEKYEDATGFRYESAIKRRERERRERDCQRAKKLREREIAGQWRDVIKRFKAVVAGRKVERCDYFGWRDAAGRDSTAVEWTPISHTDVITALRASGLDFGTRTVERLESGERDVVRLGLHGGIRYRRADTDA